MKHVAAIDAGSNGLRLVIGAVDGMGAVVEVERGREAVRLGQDAFDHGSFTPMTIDAVVRAFEKFQQRIEARGVEHLHAVATSAAREASNGGELIQRIADATGIHLEIIDPLEEARLMLLAAAAAVDLRGRTALLIDMGGGSVEATVVRDSRRFGCESLPIGPVRLLHELRKRQLHESDADQLLDHYQNPLADFIRMSPDGAAPQICIGVGGSVECLGELRMPMLGKARAGKVTRTDLDRMIPALLAMPVWRRIEQLGLRPDRADLIALAAMVLRMIVDQALVPEVLILRVGLKDGLLREVARQAAGEGGG